MPFEEYLRLSKANQIQLHRQLDEWIENMNESFSGAPRADRRAGGF